ncbi:MAG TPA: bifunctional diaminohydroxyphosphoribosylaminopyrimidine deaminase/5-amino-6-(5-phosphoribosylamino)uracil reductase RibD, partial [Gemmatimonadales bacterium]|nr:bifunctional diaminohydroxyphosphoribosylaminopyrimidine deaminase/5-amino-6-(5-phosphoribosylamino)uracil reductase RibD [Gemmatimonadales bacterium]
MTEKEALHRALGLALRGWGRVSPNPLVGCVLLQGEVVVGEGWHAEYGQAHAERMALAAAGERARGATAVVTLEPCAHQGKQPPCADALIAAGVKRVVIAAPDPNPEARGGAAKLRAAGIEVAIGPMEAEARRINAPFYHRFADAERPWIALKLATSVDGMIAPRERARVQLSGPEAEAWVHEFRAGFDAIAVGGTTAIVDDPQLTVRGAVVPRVPPRRVVFAGDRVLPPHLKLLTDGGPPTLVLRGHDLAGTLKRLRQEEGIGSMLVEGGAELAAALVAARVVDQYYWIRTPRELGGPGIPAHPWFGAGTLNVPGGWRVIGHKSLGVD